MPWPSVVDYFSSMWSDLGCDEQEAQNNVIEVQNLVHGRDPEGESVEGHRHTIASIKESTTSTIIIMIIVINDVDTDFSIHLVVIRNPSVNSYVCYINHSYFITSAPRRCFVSLYLSSSLVLRNMEET